MSNTKGTSVINNPQGGGAQSGLGEKFSPDLFSGTGNFSIPIAVPPGRNGFQPELTLGYSSGNGNGVFGMGWTLSIPGVMRKTSKGIPIYKDDSDIFILSGAEDLVPIKIEKEILPGNIGYERTFYRPRTEGLFARIIRHKKTNGEHYWEVRSKDGLISWYGTPGASTSLSNQDPAVVADPENRSNIFSWALTKTEDPFGNVILYGYTREMVVTPSSANDPHIYDQIYLSTIKYAQYLAGSLTKYLCEVRFEYEERPDPHSSYKQGFEMRTTKRCVRLETYTNAVSLIKTKTYHFSYNTNLPLNGATLLKSVSVEGHPSSGSGEQSEFMPPLEFGYSVFDPAKRDLQEITGPFPLNSLAEPGFELVDVTGNGIPDLLQLNGTARYWTNKGNGQFGPPKNLNLTSSFEIVPSAKAEGAGMPGIAFIDANGDGRTDLLVLNGLTSGYFPGAFKKVWNENGFRPYSQNPSFSLSDPEVQLIDLDGDGITDVLRNGAKFECFYNNPEKGFNKVRTAIKTFADFSFSDPRIRFADMTGDGMQDIVLISSGRVQYWPNLGYGRFGKKVNMKNAPVFPEQYDPKQILLGDLDGDGQADIAFVENNKITLYVNQSGNSFSDGVKIANTPRVYNLNSIRICDIMGTGQAGILWSFGPDAGTPGKMFFLDMTKGNKPYVLEEMNNNMGSITRVKYGSSVYHFLRDELNPITRWKTQLPFPVQVVNKVEVLDLLSGGKLVTEYNYHNGYWDGVEREFRGFAHVDSKDTESFEKFNVQDLFVDENVSTVSTEFYNPPTLTKSWFYVGPVGDGFNRWKEPDFSDEYWSSDANILQRPLSMINLLNELPRRARRDALRTLRGTLLRSELYGLDGSSFEERPYTVTESLMSVRMEFNPSLLPNALWAETSGYASGGGYIFFPFNVAQRTTQYERGNDPMHNFNFTKEYDAYGQPQGQLSVGMPRGSSPLSGGNGDYLATYSISDFIYKDLGAGQYMVNRQKRTVSYDATQSAIGKNIFSFRDSVFNSVAGLPVINCTLCFYDGNAFTGLAYGQIGNFGAQVRCETLVITDAIITDGYGASVPQCFESTPDWNTGYPAAFAGLLQNSDARLGYKDRRVGFPDYIPGWYSESPRIKYDFQIGSPFYGLVMESKDVFDNLSTIEYDVYNVLPVKSKQWLNGTDYLDTTATYDYRVMQPFEVRDVNENYSEFDFSPLGLLRASAVIGKGTEGDYKSNTGGYYDMYAPSVRMEYDFFAFKNSGDPVFVKTINREKHYQQSAVSPTIEKVEYSDGFGRLIQTRVQAEDVIFGNQTFGSSGLPADQTAQNGDAVGIQRGISDPINVVVSGWKIYNNKGKVVEQYEPFFDKGFDYVMPDLLGVKVKMFYDVLGRVVKTKNPDNSEQWVIYGVPNALNAPTNPVLQNATFQPTPWINFTYDANDLAPLTNPTGSNVSPTHYYTPKSAEVDALGRTIKTKEYFDNTNYNNVIEMNYFYDIRGNLLLVKDPLNRNVFEHVYDLRTPGQDQPLPPLKTVHIDKGLSTVLFDALGKPIESHDAKGAQALSAYDVLQRPTHGWARNKTAEATGLRTVIQYGDNSGLINPQNQNLKGKVYRNYDEAGRLEMIEYDFKGNLLKKVRQVIDDSFIKPALNSYTAYLVDWSSFPAILNGFLYETDTEFDALNRVTKLKLPANVNSLRKDIIPTYNNAGALEKVNYDGTDYVKHIAYNAKGQRLLIAIGNDVMTRYVYDSFTFRLIRQRSEAFTFSQTGNTITYAYQSGTNKQDDKYVNDLIGNITEINIRTSTCGVGGTNSLDRTFAYDSIYRLTQGTGRENVSGASYPFPGWQDMTRSTTPNTTVACTRNYSYDKLGNIQQIQQVGTNAFTRTYNYTTGTNKLSGVTIGANSYAFTYDSCGNQLIENVNRKFDWDDTDRLLFFRDQVGTSEPTVEAQYLYDSSGKRVKKIVRKQGGIFEIRVYIDGVFEFFTDETDVQNTVHIMDDQSRVATIRIGAAIGDPTPAVKYELNNNIGSSMLLLDNLGAEVNSQEYYPFGETSFGSYAKKRYQYVGKERDEESGLYYYGARYYAAWTCRFISIDKLAKDYMYLSPYNYANNNPINDYDIDGNQDNESKKDSPPNQNNNTGNLVIVIRKEGDPDLDSKQLKDYASGWDVVQVKDFSEAKEWIKSNYQVDGKATEIKNLVIATHAIPQGGKDYSLIVGEKKFGFNTEVTAKILDERAIKGPNDYVKGKVINYAKDQLAALQSIIKENTSSTATIVMAGCELGRANNALKWASFLNAGGDRTVFLNTDRTTFGGTAKVGGSKEKSFIITSLNMTDMKEFANGTASGWIKHKFNALTGGVLEKTQSIVLLFDGKNGKLVEHKTTDYRKKQN